MNCAHEEGLFHDCAYVDARNALIPAAEKEADRMHMMAAGLPGPGWDRCFFATMNRLWAERAAAPKLELVRTGT